MMTQPEAPDLTLGFIALIDSAPLVAAREQGFFEAEGLNVRLAREVSWANIRDKLVIGEFSAAHMLAPLPLAITLGASGVRTPLLTALSLGLNGNAVTVSNALREQLLTRDPAAADDPRRSLRALKRVVDERARAGLAPLIFATVHPFSCHCYLLRYWLAAGGIDPDQDVNLIVIPPREMPGQLAAGRIDGLCVGEPWNQVAAARGNGLILLGGRDIWQNAPEKVLAVRSDWAAKHPRTHRALLRAVLRASLWLEEPAHRIETAALLARPEYLGVPAATIEAGLACGGHVFHRYAATFPWRSHALWLLGQMIRWGQINRVLEWRGLATRVYRTDLYREAAADLGLPSPSGDTKTEGGHAAEWPLGPLTMGPDRFIDARSFDPERPLAFVAGSDISHVTIAAESFVEPSFRPSPIGGGDT